MLAIHLTAVAISSGYGLSPTSCILPHIGVTAGPEVIDHDEMAGTRSRGSTYAAALQAPVQKQEHEQSAKCVQPKRARSALPNMRMTLRSTATAAAAAALSSDVGAAFAATQEDAAALVEQTSFLATWPGSFEATALLLADDNGKWLSDSFLG